MGTNFFARMGKERTVAFMRKEKVKYNMGQNSWYMIKLAWTTGE